MFLKKRKQILKIYSLILIQALILGNSVWAAESSTLSPKLEIYQPAFQNFYSQLSNFENKEQLAKSESLPCPKPRKKLSSLTRQVLNSWQEKWHSYWDYYLPFLKKFKTLGFNPADIKVLFKVLKSNEYLYSPDVGADALYYLAKHLLSEEIGFMHFQAYALLFELARHPEPRKIMLRYFHVIDELEEAGFDYLEIEKIISSPPSSSILINEDAEKRLDLIEHRLSKVKNLKAENWRKKDAILNEWKLSALLIDENRKAENAVLNIFQRIREEMQEVIELDDRVMAIDVDALLSGKADADEIYQGTVSEIKYMQRLLSGKRPADPKQKKTIDQANRLMAMFLNNSGISFSPFPVYFTSNDQMHTDAAVEFMPYCKGVISQAEIHGDKLLKALIHEGLHANSRGYIQTRLNEGMTEYLRDKFMMLSDGYKDLTYDSILEYHFENFTAKYVPELHVILLLLYNFGEDALFNAYFRGDTKALEKLLGWKAWEKLQELAVQYEYASEDKIKKEYSREAEKLLKTLIPGFKTFDTEESEKTPLDYRKPDIEFSAEPEQEYSREQNINEGIKPDENFAEVDFEKNKISDSELEFNDGIINLLENGLDTNTTLTVTHIGPDSDEIDKIICNGINPLFYDTRRIKKRVILYSRKKGSQYTAANEAVASHADIIPSENLFEYHAIHGSLNEEAKKEIIRGGDIFIATGGFADICLRCSVEDIIAEQRNNKRKSLIFIPLKATSHFIITPEKCDSLVKSYGQSLSLYAGSDNYAIYDLIQDKLHRMSSNAPEVVLTFVSSADEVFRWLNIINAYKNRRKSGKWYCEQAPLCQTSIFIFDRRLFTRLLVEQAI